MPSMFRDRAEFPFDATVSTQIVSTQRRRAGYAR
jgi:hypothetical protein